jgi:predicted NAD/FAD-binding protein
MVVGEPVRVVIIGGGCGAMTAAYELSRPEHNGRYAITVYQQGWRLGGKGPQAVVPPVGWRSTDCMCGWASMRIPSA